MRWLWLIAALASCGQERAPEPVSTPESSSPDVREEIERSRSSLASDPARAVVHAEAAVAAAPDQVEAWVALSWARMAGEQWPEAIEAASRAVALDPRSWEAHSALGHAKLRGGDRGGRDELVRAMELGSSDPRDPIALARTAKSRENLRDPEREGALERARGSVTALLALASASLTVGATPPKEEDHDVALAALDQATARDDCTPEDRTRAEALYARAEALQDEWNRQRSERLTHDHGTGDGVAGLEDWGPIGTTGHTHGRGGTRWGPPRITGPISVADFEAALDRDRGERACVRGRPGAPWNGATSEVRFGVAPDGSVTRVEALGTQIPRSVQRCIERVCRDRRFPATESGFQAAVDLQAEL